MLERIGAWLSSSIIGALAKPFVDAYRINQKAKSEYNAQAAKVSLAQIGQDMEARRNVKEIRLATASFWEMRLLTFFIAFPFVVHAAAVGIDTTFSLGWSIAAYPKPFDEWEGRILLSFFGLQGGIVVGKGIAWALARRR